MRLYTFAATIVLLSAAVPARAQSLSNDSIQVGIFGYDRDGSVVVSAWDSVPSKKSMVFASGFCRVGAGFRDLPDYATDAWRFSWTSIGMVGEAAIIQVDWQRILNARQPVTEPGGSVQLTLHWGERVVLDDVAYQSTPGCTAAAMSFEARHGTHPMRTGVREKDNTGSGSAAGAPRVPSTAGGTTSSVRVARRFSVNVWFVRSSPGKPDEVLAHPVLVTDKNGAFRFAPVRIDVRDGSIDVLVSGTFSITSDGDSNQLTFVTERRASWKALNATRDAPPDITGSSRTTIPVPGPDEVISFEMPPVRFNGRPALPDQFAIRVQITPR